MSESHQSIRLAKMALSGQLSVVLKKRTEAGLGKEVLPCCYTDLYPGEEHFREFKRTLKEKEEEELLRGESEGMSSGDGATVRTGLAEMDETGVKGRARAGAKSVVGDRSMPN